MCAARLTNGATLCQECGIPEMKLSQAAEVKAKSENARARCHVPRSHTHYDIIVLFSLCTNPDETKPATRSRTRTGTPTTNYNSWMQTLESRRRLPRRGMSAI